MSDPENHTVRLLREFRKEFKDFNLRFDDFRKQTDKNFGHLGERLDSLGQAVIGESVLGRYAAAEVEERLDALEKRLSTLEKRR
ncbi:MAG: hypothetical protein QOJ96_2133 [Alphaproteobacteria bacterium]|nr:hypothetical protein [Alphaproteobacteria bacterium]